MVAMCFAKAPVVRDDRGVRVLLESVIAASASSSAAVQAASNWRSSALS